MIKNKKSKSVVQLDANDLYGYTMFTFFPKKRLKWIDPKNFDSNKYSGNQFERLSFRS